MPYELHYASISLEDDIPCYKIKTDAELFAFIIAEYSEDCVYLISINDKEFINDNIFNIITFIGNNFSNVLMNIIEKESANYEEPIIQVFIQEYESYEEAYKVALSMKEDNKLCYSK